MVIKYTFILDSAIVYIPDNVQWEIFTRSFNARGNEDFGLYLLVGSKEYVLSDADSWCSERNIPYYEIGDLYNDAVTVIMTKFAENPNLLVIDIDEIIHKLVGEKYEDLWLAKGYIEIKDGVW